MTARQARRIRRRSISRSARREHLGVSELFTASPEDLQVIWHISDWRCLLWLLGFKSIPTNAEPAVEFEERYLLAA